MRLLEAMQTLGEENRVLLKQVRPWASSKGTEPLPRKCVYENKEGLLDV